MTLTRPDFKRFLDKVANREDHLHLFSPPPSFRIPTLITTPSPETKRHDVPLLSLLPEILLVIYSYLSASDRIILSLTCKALATTYRDLRLSDDSIVKVMSPGKYGTPTPNDLVIRLSTHYWGMVRFCRRCRLFRTCDRLFWWSVHDHVMQIIDDGGDLNPGFGKGMKKFEKERLPLWASPRSCGDLTKLQQPKIAAMKESVEKWCDVEGILVEATEAGADVGAYQNWMCCPGHIFDPHAWWTEWPERGS